MDIADVHKNTKLVIDGIPYNVEVADFVKPGKGRAIYRFRLRNLLDSNILDRTFHSGEKVDEANITTEDKQYLYEESDHYVFMNTSNFEQSFITEEQLGKKKGFLKEGEIVTVVMMGDKPLDITLPTFVELEVKDSSVTTRTDTVTAQMKSARLQTGLTIEVPTFVKEGDVIKVDTRSGKYVERVTTKK